MSSDSDDDFPIASNEKKPYYQRVRELYQHDDRIAWTGFENTEKKLHLITPRRPPMPTIDPEDLHKILDSDTECDIEITEKCSVEPFQHSCVNCEVCDVKNDITEQTQMLENIETPQEKCLIDDKSKKNSSENNGMDISNTHEQDFTWRDLELDLQDLNNDEPSTAQSSSEVSKNHESEKSTTGNNLENTHKDECSLEIEENVQDLVSNFLNDSKIQDELLNFVQKHTENKEQAEIFKKNITKRMNNSYKKSIELQNDLVDMKYYLQQIKELMLTNKDENTTYVLEKLSHIESLLQKLCASDIETKSENEPELLPELKWHDDNFKGMKFSPNLVKPVHEICNNLLSADTDSKIHKNTEIVFESTLPTISVYPVESDTDNDNSDMTQITDNLKIKWFKESRHDKNSAADEENSNCCERKQRKTSPRLIFNFQEEIDKPNTNGINISMLNKNAPETKQKNKICDNKPKNNDQRGRYDYEWLDQERNSELREKMRDIAKMYHHQQMKAEIIPNYATRSNSYSAYCNNPTASHAVLQVPERFSEDNLSFLHGNFDLKKKKQKYENIAEPHVRLELMLSNIFNKK